MKTLSKYFFVSILGLAALSTIGRAENLGVHGHTWPIIEIDMRKLLAQMAANVNWNGIEKKESESAHSYFKSLPKRDIPTVDKTTTKWINPSIVLSKNIVVPEKDSKGNWYWRVLYKKGTRFNPLSVERPEQAMLFFNARSKYQVAFVKKVLSDYPYRVLPVDVDGNDPLPLSKSLGIPVYEATSSMLERFPVFAVPALLYPGQGPERLRLGMTAFSYPYSVAQVSMAWPSIRMPKSNQTGDHHAH